MIDGKLERGESRIVRVLPCPPNFMHRTNAYWQLCRAARRLWEHPRMFALTWNGGDIKNELEAIEILRRLAHEQPLRPIARWDADGMGIVREICCPKCETVFEFEGNFYAPTCPSCKSFLQSRIAVTGRATGAGSTQTEGSGPGVQPDSGLTL
jgi:hypothetical protein